MANKMIAVFLMCIVAVAALQVRDASAEDVYKTCFEECDKACTGEGNGGTFCEMKCDTDCVAKEVAAKLNIKVP